MIEQLKCMGANCGSITGEHSPECLLEAYITFGCDQAKLHDAARVVFNKIDARDARIAELEGLLRDVVATQQANYGNSIATHMAMSTMAGVIKHALSKEPSHG